TLPMQMGVSVVPLASPLTADARAKMKLLGEAPATRVRIAPYDPSPADAAPFDSVPGNGFDSEPDAAALVPPEGNVTRTRRPIALGPAQNSTCGALNRAWKDGAQVQLANGRYIVGNLSDAQQTDLVKSLALSAERTDGNGQALRRPRV